MAEKDITTKKILKHIVKDIAHYVFNIKLDEAEILETEYQRVEERRADLVIKARQGQRIFILHIEIQNDNQAIMPLRMMRYYTDIALAYPDISDIEQYLIYIGKDSLRMPAGIENNNHQYRYHLVDMHSIDCEIFLNDSNPHAVVLAILCDFKNKDKQEIIKQLLIRLRDLTIGNTDQYYDCLLALEILSENRDLEGLLQKEAKMLSEIKIEKLPTYKIIVAREKAKAEGKAEGKAEAEEKIIQQMLDFFDDKKIHEITGVALVAIKKIRAGTH